MNIPTQDSRHTILKVLVGSHAHGLATQESDQDFRSVYVIPTEEIFRLDFTYPRTSWTKDGGDEASWEIGQFLSLATQSHPLILETFLAPVLAVDQWGEELRGLFPAAWSPQKAYQAFTGYANNQRTKFLEKRDGRPAKYAAAYIRVLGNLCELLETGTFTIRISDSSLGQHVARMKAGNYRVGEVIELGEELTQTAARHLASCQHRSDVEGIDQFLIRLRKAFLLP